MHIRAIPIATVQTELHRKRRAWPPPALKEPSYAQRMTPQRWQHSNGHIGSFFSARV